ncbi:asparagine synthase (glutamine-hydrolyzing) [Marinobacter confluentis]|uniref:asparagine synthase (glutamine-hydrolyzing) n=1 Tax=Marinobacter confluentis TaxID=1697557 RepID=UPI00143D3CA3|nr:asparagine synthase (glutamine-hydrolyzing) [Marinobacter confluentis]
MCGIAGFCQPENKLSLDDLKVMTNALQRRGPDDSGYFFDDFVGIGMRRLSIIDLDHGRQPVQSFSGRYVMVFNGEIYNYKVLQKELIDLGYSFKSNGDAEVIVNLYEHEGIKAINRLRGMFAIAIWDSEKDELILIRDQLGIKPLFFNIDGSSLLFGSEIKALLEVMPQKLEVDAQALDALFAYTYIPAPLSIWKNIRKLRPGHFLKWRAGKIEEHRYWDLLDAMQGPQPTTENIQDSIKDAVNVHLVSDVEVGAFLSGGMDSSTIVALMQQQIRLPINALSINFTSNSHLFDETIYAKELSLDHGFNLKVHSVDSSDYSASSAAIQAFDEPFADDSIVPSMAISELAARKLKVVLSGAGGDEIFGGYNRYQGIALHQLASKAPVYLRKFVISPLLKSGAKLVGSGTRRGDLLRRFADSLHASADDAYLGYITAATPSARQKLFAPHVLEQIDMNLTVDLIRDCQLRSSTLDPVKRSMYVDFCTYLPEDVLALSDRIGMWHSLEIRTPLADRILAETAFRLPVSDLVTSRNKKIAFQRAITPWLPKSILSHPKQGFEGPTASWLKGAGADVIRKLIKEDLDLGHNLLNHSELEDLLGEHVAGKFDHAKRLFSALAVMQWTSIYSHRIGGVT